MKKEPQTEARGVHPTPIGLDPDGCRMRQDRMRQFLRERGLDAALLRDLRLVQYFTAYWSRAALPAAAIVALDGPVTLVTGAGVEPGSAVDNAHTYISDRLSTMIDDLDGALMQVVSPRLGEFGLIGTDLPIPLDTALECRVESIAGELLKLRRTKDEDEVAMIRRAIAGCEAAYARAREILRPGVTEVQVYAQMHAAAVDAVGEPIGPMGNDFRAGEGGGPPRTREVEAGELMPLDIGINVRGYHCDLCRTFSVDGDPTDAQQQAHALVVEALKAVEAEARPGARCKDLYSLVFELIDGQHGWSFPHHLGHGIGLSPHEAPRNNPNWDDTLEVGDVYTFEPGLYGKDLCSGLRLEQNYVVRPEGVERLSSYPLDL